MANRYQRIDIDLKKCYEFDVDWTLLPDKVRQVWNRSLVIFLNLANVQCLGHDLSWWILKLFISTRFVHCLARGLNSEKRPSSLAFSPLYLFQLAIHSPLFKNFGMSPLFYGYLLCCQQVRYFSFYFRHLKFSFIYCGCVIWTTRT